MNTQSIYNHFRKLTIGTKSSGNSSASNNNNIECENEIGGKGKNFCQVEKDKKKKKKDKKESCQATFDEINNCEKTGKFEFELDLELSQQVKRGQQKQLEVQQQQQQQQQQQHHQYQPQHRQQHKLLDSRKGVNATASYSIQATSNKYYDDEDQEIEEEEEEEEEENNHMNSTFDNKQHCDVAIGDYKSALRNQQLVAGRLFANKNKESYQQYNHHHHHQHQQLPYLYHTNAQMLAMSSDNIQTDFSQINQSSANHHHQVNFGFHQTKYDDEPEQSERKKKYLTAKYGSHQMSLIKKRLRVEMMLHEELQKLAEVIFKNYNNNHHYDNHKDEDDSQAHQLAEHQLKLIDDIEIDIDSLLDMDDEIERIKSIKHTLSPLLMDKQSIKLINEFANTILEQIRLL